jgi:hypothetical protein
VLLKTSLPKLLKIQTVFLGAVISILILFLVGFGYNEISVKVFLTVDKRGFDSS